MKNIAEQIENMKKRLTEYFKEFWTWHDGGRGYWCGCHECIEKGGSAIEEYNKLRHEILPTQIVKMPLTSLDEYGGFKDIGEVLIEKFEEKLIYTFFKEEADGQFFSDLFRKSKQEEMERKRSEGRLELAEERISREENRKKELLVELEKLTKLVHSI